MKEGDKFTFIGFDGLETVAVIDDIWETKEFIHIETVQGDYVKLPKENK